MGTQYKKENLFIDFKQSLEMVNDYRYRCHDEIEILWVQTGKIELNIAGETYIMGKDDLIIINPQIGHAIFALEPNSVFISTQILPETFTSQGMDISKGHFRLRPNIDVKSPANQELRYLLSDLYLSVERGVTPFQINVMYFNLLDVMVHYFVDKPLKSPEYNEDSIIFDAVKFIEEHFTQDISLELIAQRFSYSETHMSKLFKQELGVNYYEYLTRCRLQHAVNQLVGKEKIADIAVASGFSDIRAFNKMFRKHFDQTPTQFRKEIRSIQKQVASTSEKLMIEMLQVQVIHDLKEYKSNYEHTQIRHNPCDHCVAKIYKERYDQLVQKINDLVVNE